MADEKEKNNADAPLTRKDLLDYAVKINDREIVKTRNTGFTILALLTAIGAIGYKIFEFFPINQSEQGNFLVIFTALANFVLVAYRLWLDLCNEYNKVYLSNGVRNYNFSINALMWGIIIFTAIFLNWKSDTLYFNVFKYNFTLNEWFICSYILIIISNPIRYFIHDRKKKIKKIEYEIIDLRIDSYKFWLINYMKVKVPVFLLIILIVYFNYEKYIFYFDDYNNFCLRNIKIIQLSCMVMTICILIVVSIKQSIISLTNKYSENIEKNIIASDLSANEIKRNIVKHFGCQTLYEWIQEQRDFQQEYLKDIDRDVLEIPKRLNILKCEIKNRGLNSNEMYAYIYKSINVVNKHRLKYEEKTKELKKMWVEVGCYSYEAEEIDKIINLWDANFELFEGKENNFQKEVEELIAKK